MSSGSPLTLAERLARSQVPSQATVQEVIDEAGVKIKRLLTTEDYLGMVAQDDVKYLQNAISYGKTLADKEIICQSMTKMKIRKVFARIWEKHFNDNFCDPDGGKEELNSIMMGIVRVMVSCTDKCVDLCVDLYKGGAYKNLVKYLKLPQLSIVAELDRKESLRQQRCLRIVRDLLFVLLNVVQYAPESRDPIRDLRAVPLLKELRGAMDELASSISLIILAYLVTEEENDELISDEKTFQYFVNILGACLDTSNHRSTFFGYTAAEMLSALNRLAVNDSNKLRIVKAGALPEYVRALQSDRGDILKEQRLAAEGLWTLAFKCKDDIIKEPGCVEALTKLSESSADPEVKKQVDGVLWMIRGNDRAPTPQSPTSGALGPPPRTGGTSRQARLPTKSDKADQHVFISYQWDCKDAVLQLRDKLRASGFKVWVDVDSMSGSVLEAMAAAVENAAVVLICLTNKYKESPNCRTEAEYTFRLHKSIVPLRFQKRYYPDGWLGALIGSKLVHDFTKEFEIVYPDLVRDLDNRGRVNAVNAVNADGDRGSHSQGQGSHSQGQRSNFQGQGSNGQGQGSSNQGRGSKAEGRGSNGLGQSSTLEKWTKSNVSEWLNRHKLNHQKDWFSEFDGSLLQEFRLMRRDAPEQFHLLLRDNNFSVIDIMKLNRALKEL